MDSDILNILAIVLSLIGTVIMISCVVVNYFILKSLTTLKDSLDSLYKTTESIDSNLEYIKTTRLE